MTAAARPLPPASVAPLLAALADPAACTGFDEGDWDGVIRLARNARLLGVLAHRAGERIDLRTLPDRVQRHLQAGDMEARFRAQKTRHLLDAITPALAGHPGPWVLLKGAAYLLQRRALAHGRLPGDVDLMIRRSALDGVEQALLHAGWDFQKTDPYDQHYYRAWSHELPAMQAAGQALELDLHHTILPPPGRIRPATERLFADAVPIEGTPFHALCATDQLLHAVVHLVHDSDCVGRLRDLVDVDALFRALPVTDPAALDALVERARLHGMEGPLALAARLSCEWFGTPGVEGLVALGGGWLHGAGAARLICRVLGPTDVGVDRSRAAAMLLGAREHWMRMPPWLLAYHAGAKGLRALTRVKSGEPAAPG